MYAKNRMTGLVVLNFAHFFTVKMNDALPEKKQQQE